MAVGGDPQLRRKSTQAVPVLVQAEAEAVVVGTGVMEGSEVIVVGTTVEDDESPGQGGGGGICWVHIS